MTTAGTAGFTATWAITMNLLPPIIAGLDAKAAMAVSKAAHDIEAGMKSRVPVDTGYLKNSIQAIKIGALVWRVVVGAEYGLYVEWGTSRMRAQPFASPAIQVVRPQFLAAMRALVTFP